MTNVGELQIQRVIYSLYYIILINFDFIFIYSPIQYTSTIHFVSYIPDMSDIDLPLQLSRATTASPSLHLSTNKIKLTVHLNHQNDLSEEKPSSSTNIQASSPAKKHDATSLILDKTDPDSQFQFSEEIMLLNTQNKSRNERQSTKLPWLTILEWMANTCSGLGLSKETLYSGFLVFKMFAASQQKNSMNLKNSRMFALTSLLVSSKVDSMGGNFLLGMEKVVDGSCKVQKEELVKYQSALLKSLEFKLPSKTYITEVLIKLMLAWNKLAEEFNLKCLSFCFEVDQSQNGKKARFIFFRKYLFLIDFVLIRKIVMLPNKYLSKLETSFFFELNLCNIFYHLAQMALITNSRQHLLTSFREAYEQLVKQLNSCPKQYLEYFRQSRLLCKQIRKMFANASFYFGHLDKYFCAAKRANQGNLQHFQKQAKFGSSQKNTNEAQISLQLKQNKQAFALNPKSTDIPVQAVETPSYQTAIQLVRLRLIIDRQIYIPLMSTKRPK